jgi:hypothetical protein
MARPTKLTDELSAEICAVLEEGASLETAAEAAGIDVSTLYRWIDRGLSGEEPFAAFCEAYTRARAKGELTLFRRLALGDSKGISFGPARAAAFLLERSRPEKYAQRINVKVDEAVSEVLEVVRGICSPADCERICEELERRHRGGGTPPPPGDPGVIPAGIH